MNAWEITLIGTEAGRTAEAPTEAPLSFDEAFAAHQRLVYRYAFSLTRDTALAEDVTQEVFLRLHSYLDESQRAGMLRAWLLRVTANVARNILRTRIRAAARDEAFAQEMSRTASAAVPDDELARQAAIAKAQRALAKLKEPLRSCLMLRNEGLSYREISGALGIKETSALPFLLDVVRSTTLVEVRLEAIEQLDEFDNDPTVVDELIKLIASEKDIRIQRALVEALEEIEVPKAQAALTELASKSSSIEIRRTAIEALAEREDEASAQSLVQLYDTEKDERIKATIIEALGESEHKVALRKLTEIALKDPAGRLRKQALEEIADSDDPDAYKFLEEVLKKN